MPLRVAFIGLGVMGYPMAGHLARAGHEVTVFNRTANNSPATFNPFTVPNDKFTGPVRTLEGLNAELLDGFVHDTFDIGGTQVGVRVGRHTLIWGESLFFGQNGIAAGQAPLQKRFRIGGMVVKGSVSRKPGDLQVRFVLTDFAHQVPVEYTGVLPDLFREGQGIIAHGTMGPDGAFVADEVLAKHDEKYMPPEVAASLKQKAAAANTAGPKPSG